MRQIVYLLGLLTIFSCNEKSEKKEESLEETARRIHNAVITIDTHNDINISNFTLEKNYTQRLSTQVNLPKME